jgi:hypothetical protein
MRTTRTLKPCAQKRTGHAQLSLNRAEQKKKRSGMQRTECMQAWAAKSYPLHSAMQAMQNAHMKNRNSES